MKTRILFIALTLIVFSGSATSLSYNCAQDKGHVLAVVNGNSKSCTQECIDAGYSGCLYCCADPVCNPGGPPSGCTAFISCGADDGGLVCCTATPTEIVNTTLCSIVVTFWGIAAAVASFMIVLAGVRWSGSMEDPQTRKEAKTTIIHAIVGLIIVMVAMEIANWLFIGAGSFSIYQFSCSP